MGTNFYFMTKVKAQAQKWAPYTYELTDTPEFGYKIHVAKISIGWLPLFQAHRCGAGSVLDYCQMYGSGDFTIYDENDEEYTWERFEEEVLYHNGGVNGVLPKVKLPPIDPNVRWYDPDMPDHTPVSHLEYGGGKYANKYYVDPEGYEFTADQFS